MLVERPPIDPGTSDYSSCQYVLLALDPLEELQKKRPSKSVRYGGAHLGTLKTCFDIGCMWLYLQRSYHLLGNEIKEKKRKEKTKKKSKEKTNEKAKRKRTESKKA